VISIKNHGGLGDGYVEIWMYAKWKATVFQTEKTTTEDLDFLVSKPRVPVQLPLLNDIETVDINAIQDDLAVDAGIT
jgi:hypothetical protein